MPQLDKLTYFMLVNKKKLFILVILLLLIVLAGLAYLTYALWVYQSILHDVLSYNKTLRHPIDFRYGWGGVAISSIILK